MYFETKTIWNTLCNSILRMAQKSIWSIKTRGIYDFGVKVIILSCNYFNQKKNPFLIIIWICSKAAPSMSSELIFSAFHRSLFNPLTQTMLNIIRMTFKGRKGRGGEKTQTWGGNRQLIHRSLSQSRRKYLTNNNNHPQLKPLDSPTASKSEERSPTIAEALTKVGKINIWLNFKS